MLVAVGAVIIGQFEEAAAVVFCLLWVPCRLHSGQDAPHSIRLMELSPNGPGCRDGAGSCLMLLNFDR